MRVSALRLSFLLAGVCGLNLQKDSDSLTSSSAASRKTRSIFVGSTNGGRRAVHGSSAHPLIHTEGQGYRQTLVNSFNAQYVLYFTLGGQTLGGIVDSGSFEFVVFDHACKSCGTTAKYDNAYSKSYKLGSMTASQFYGSGKTQSNQAWDLMSIGPAKNINQSFWQVTGANMKVLLNSHFNAIIGLGPSETPLQDAWKVLQKDVSSGSGRVESEGSLTAELAERLKHDVDLVRAAKHRPTVLQQMREQYFSICLGKEPLSDGLIVWNDTSALRHPELFHKVPLKGKNTWSVEGKNVRLSFMSTEALDRGPSSGGGSLEEHTVFDNNTEVGMGCEEGCPFLLDTGTSLLTLPGTVVAELNKLFLRDSVTCDSVMAELPYILFEMNGKTLSLPPDVYVTRVEDDVPQYLQGNVRAQRLGRPDNKCNLMVLETAVSTKMGPLFVLGMPFFRKYYTLFKVAQRYEDRAIYLAGATEQCTPTHRRVEVHDGPSEKWQHSVDPTKLWMPLSHSTNYVRL